MLGARNKQPHWCIAERAALLNAGIEQRSSTMAATFTARFGKHARTVVAEDSLGRILFTFDFDYQKDPGLGLDRIYLEKGYLFEGRDGKLISNGADPGRAARARAAVISFLKTRPFDVVDQDTNTND